MRQKKLVRKTEPPSKRRIRWPKWTGFHNKTIWDLLQLLIVPLMLAIVGFWFAAQQDQRQQRIETHRAAAERELANQRAQDEAMQAYLDEMGHLMLKEDLRNAESDSAVATLARARTLTLVQRLDGAHRGSVIQFLYESTLIERLGFHPQFQFTPEEAKQFNQQGEAMAQADQQQEKFEDSQGCSLTTVGNTEDIPKSVLKASRSLSPSAPLNGSSTQPSSQLPSAEEIKPAVSLRGANLAHAELQNADLRSADLTGVDLHEADLRSALDYASLMVADLEGATLEGVVARNVDLQGARLKDANLRRGNMIAVSLDEANLRSADLSDALLVESTFHHANLRGANLSDANLSQADLSCADLSNANLSDANLSNADLSVNVPPDMEITEVNDTNLDGTNLSGADLSGADLEGANGITTERLEAQAKSLQGATMPNGQKNEE